jgi:hypothetical protein
MEVRSVGSPRTRDRRYLWIPAAAVVVSILGVVGAWWFTGGADEQPCTPAARDSLVRVAAERHQTIPQLVFHEVDDSDCESAGNMAVSWSHPSLSSLRDVGLAIGCRAPKQLPVDDQDAVLTCVVDGREAFIYLEWQDDPAIAGLMELVDDH